ncbi:hypothetical protein ACLOJK_004335 [Asimina triloba]
MHGMWGHCSLMAVSLVQILDALIRTSQKVSFYTIVETQGGKMWALLPHLTTPHLGETRGQIILMSLETSEISTALYLHKASSVLWKMTTCDRFPHKNNVVLPKQRRRHLSLATESSRIGQHKSPA